MLEALMGWIQHDAGRCPCVGERVVVECEEHPDLDIIRPVYGTGIARDNDAWRYVTRYRLVARSGDLV